MGESEASVVLLPISESTEMRPRTMSAPDDASPTEIKTPIKNCQRSKSVRIQQPPGVICHRSNSVISRNGKRIVKNLSRIDSFEESPEPKNTVRLFRLNSFVKDTGKKEDEGDEPERQQWDNPIEFLLSCISMSVGLVRVSVLFP